MNDEQIIRAWKDSNYRNSLDPEKLALLPSSPAGTLLADAELENVVGQIAISIFNCNNNYYQYNSYNDGNSYNDSTNIDRSSSFNFFRNNFYGD